MRKIPFILLLLIGMNTAAQTVRVTDFCQTSSEVRDPRELTTRVDVNGDLCAVVRVLTEQDGWTFDAGLAGIVDTRYEKGAVCLYIPASAKTLSFSHYKYGVLRGWTIPESLAPGASYELRLKYSPKPLSRPVTTKAPVIAPKITESKPVSTSPKHSSGLAAPSVPVGNPYTSPSAPVKVLPGGKTAGRSYCKHFIDGYFGACFSGGYYYDTYIGLRYSYMGFKVGPYASLALSFDGEFNAIAGVGVHLLPEERSNFDLQAYAGLGIAEGCLLAGELGLRFAWKTDYDVSHWDFGFGAQVWSGCIMPTVNVGLYLWGIPVSVGIGLCCLAVGI